MRADQSIPTIPGLGFVLGVLILCLVGAGIAGLRHPIVDLPGSPRTASGALPDLRIDLNTATVDELRVLPGIGKIMARRIADDRRVNGPFRNLNDLMRVPGIGEITVDRLRPMVFLGGE